MGKMKISNNKRKKQGGMPTWLLSTIVAIVLVVVIVTCALAILSNTGVIKRWTNVAKTDDYKVDSNMMYIYFTETYNNFETQYQSYEFSYKAAVADLPMDEKINALRNLSINTSNSYDAMLGATGTWYDYLMAMTKDGVKSMLINCEQADEMGITLSTDEKKAIKDQIKAEISTLQIQTGGMSESYCLGVVYGKGIKKIDLCRAMEIQALSDKLVSAVSQNLADDINEAKIVAEYMENKKDYDVSDYFYYRFAVSYKTVAEDILGVGYTDAKLTENKDAVDAEYKARVAKAKENGDKLAAITDISEFKKFVYDYVANESYDSNLKAQELSDEQKAAAEGALDAIKAQIMADVVAEVIAGEEKVKDLVVEETTTGEGDAAVTTYKIFGYEVKKEFADAAKKVKEKVFASVSSIDSTYTAEKSAYSETSEVSKWAFEDGRKFGDTKVIKEGDGATSDDVTITSENHNTTVYFMVKTPYQDMTPTRDFAYMLFSSSETANKAIEEIAEVEGLTKESFLELAATVGASASTEWTTYIEGDMQNPTFDEWLYDEARVAGDYTKASIIMSDGSVMVAYYIGENYPTWSMKVKSAIAADESAAYQDQMNVLHSSKVIFNDKAIQRVGK